MDKSLFIKPEPKSLIRTVVEFIAFILALIVFSALIGAAVSYGMFWWKNTLFVDKLTYKWALEEQYNKGRRFERMCNNLRVNRKAPLTDQQESFCKRHDNYKDHPQELGE